MVLLNALIAYCEKSWRDNQANLLTLINTEGINMEHITCYTLLKHTEMCDICNIDRLRLNQGRLVEHESSILRQ